ncbi:DUF7408 domain-containing protein [Lysinibacillus piscis]|uniref:Uncharacterized protein n=1 Tax=Lysinibacillus piscis TaxID=2518931 RepID=A0ABQ5NH11_9BACI|nr:hypothetical protein [Lysinibacillus sp. KH24]GLC87658.1 hypothetical protein LYSBPC_07850 [Lysinibacillus sp. KH24]
MKKTKISVLILILTFVIGLLLPMGEASAAATLEVQAKIGLMGKVKEGVATPLRVTIKNNGADFTGDIVINLSRSYLIETAPVYPISIAAGEEKTFDFYLDSLENSGYLEGNAFAFYEGGIEKGKKIAYKGSKNLQANYVDPNTTFIYTLTDKSDRLAAYSHISAMSNGGGVTVFHLNQIKDYMLPEDAKGFAQANMVIVDEVSIADLSEKQQQALLAWVQDGGTLVVGGGEQVNATAGIFKEYLPLTLSQQTTSVSAEHLTTLSGDQFTAAMTVYVATQNAGSVPILTDDQTILTAMKTVGNGKIMQTTFSLGDEPLASMTGYSALASKIVGMSNVSAQAVNSPPMINQIANNMRSINELFPSFEVSVGYIIAVIILYIVLIGPILYIVLKKLDKREHAWWIIPALSIVMSIALFVIGAKDRILQPQVQQAAIYKINEDSSLRGYYVESILTNRSGDFIVHADKKTTAMALHRNNGLTNGMNNAHEFAYSKENAEGSTLIMRDLSYWSVTSFTGKTTVENSGKMDIDLLLKDEKLTGTIKNNFPFALHDVTIQTGTKKVRLGTIEANATLQVDKELKTAILQSPPYFNNYIYQYPSKKEDIHKYLLEQMEPLALQMIQEDKKPIISAWAEQALAGVELETSATIAPISYFVQPFDSKVELTGPFTMKRNNFTYTVEPRSTNTFASPMDEQLNQWNLSDGIFDVTMTMPENFLGVIQELHELTITNKDIYRMKLAIWNNVTKQFEPLEHKEETLTEHVTDYLNDRGEVLLELTFGQGQTGDIAKLPDIELKGVTK